MSKKKRPPGRRRRVMIDAELVSWLEGHAQGMKTRFNFAVNEVLRAGMGKINRDRLAAELGDSELDRFDWMLDAELVRMLLGERERDAQQAFVSYVHQSMIDDARKVGLLEAGGGGRSAPGLVRALLRRVQARLSVMARLLAQWRWHSQEDRP